MSNQAVPISLEQFSEAIQSLPLSTLRRTGAELRNSIAHLDYSNEQLQPFADGTTESANGQPDEDCLAAIRENEIVIARMQARLARLKMEVEARGSSWLNLEKNEDSQQKVGEKSITESVKHENESYQGLSNAWKDGTISTGLLSVNDILDLEKDQVNLIPVSKNSTITNADRQDHAPVSLNGSTEDVKTDSEEAFRAKE